ncbi:ImmA/IrrE family metallo-endopeptidase [Niabella sp. 22666]|uniref:ImmA/IrrE family metallo-endopeptidase n=1 Tax=Niabella sp. 22666 TaxID=3453954 RepID=UPI003F863783
MKVANFNPIIIENALNTNQGDILIEFPNAENWITGEKIPTIKQLAAFAKALRIPFGFLFVKNPPELRTGIPLFRTNKKEPVFNYSTELRDTVFYIQQRQDWLREFLQKEGEPPLQFAGKYKTEKSPKALAEVIRTEIELTKDWSKGLQNKNEAFQFLVNKIEDVGVFVAVNGIVENNTKRPLNLDEFRGFVLYDNYAPYIFINGKDFPGGRIFTLIHELVHIWLGQSSITEYDSLKSSSNDIEHLCDATAAEILVPEERLKQQWEIVKNIEKPIPLLERQFKVSQLVIARRLLDMELINKAQYFSFYNNYVASFQNKPESEGGNFYHTQNTRIGRAFFQQVLKATLQGKLLYSDAYKLTSLNGSTFEKYQNEYAR